MRREIIVQQSSELAPSCAVQLSDGGGVSGAVGTVDRNGRVRQCGLSGVWAVKGSRRHIAPTEDINQSGCGQR